MVRIPHFIPSLVFAVSHRLDCCFRKTSFFFISKKLHSNFIEKFNRKVNMRSSNRKALDQIVLDYEPPSQTDGRQEMDFISSSGVKKIR